MGSAQIVVVDDSQSEDRKEVRTCRLDPGRDVADGGRATLNVREIEVDDVQGDLTDPLVDVGAPTPPHRGSLATTRMLGRAHHLDLGNEHGTRPAIGRVAQVHIYLGQQNSVVCPAGQRRSQRSAQASEL